MTPAIDCPRIEALSALLDGEIPAAERDAVSAHAAACPICGAALQDFLALRGTLKTFADAKPGVDIASLIADRLEPRERPLRARPRRTGWRWQVFPAGFAAAGVLATGVYLGLLLGGGSAVASRTAAMAVFEALPPGALCAGASSCYRSAR